MRRLARSRCDLQPSYCSSGYHHGRACLSFGAAYCCFFYTENENNRVKLWTDIDKRCADMPGAFHKDLTLCIAWLLTLNNGNIARTAPEFLRKTGDWGPRRPIVTKRGWRIASRRIIKGHCVRILDSFAVTFPRLTENPSHYAVLKEVETGMYRHW